MKPQQLSSAVQRLLRALALMWRLHPDDSAGAAVASKPQLHVLAAGRAIEEACMSGIVQVLPSPGHSGKALS